MNELYWYGGTAFKSSVRPITYLSVYCSYGREAANERLVRERERKSCGMQVQQVCNTADIPTASVRPHSPQSSENGLRKEQSSRVTC